MIYLISCRRKDDKIVEMSTESDQLIKVCDILENSTSIINYKVSNVGATGIAQDKFGVGDFQKWVTSNF